ncbi:hypothetical protein AB9K21_01785 [Anaplasma phagocytophilum]|uniref:hypothetical protein n=1 Tax=Anaplasma phagocytophilum TaxID=948 RepID=UPI003D9510A7
MNLGSVSGRIFVVHSSELFWEVVAKFVDCRKIDTVVVPNRSDAECLQFHFSKQCGIKDNIEVLAFSEIVKSAYEDDIEARAGALLLCMQFIEEWNALRHTDYPASLAKELLLMLDEIYLNCTDLDRLSASLEEEDLFGYRCLTSEFLIDFARWWKSTGHSNASAIAQVERFFSELCLSGKKVAVAGIASNRAFSELLRSIFESISESFIILPDLDLEMPEHKWKTLEMGHHQYRFMKLLDALGVRREEVSILGQRDKNHLVDLAFNFEIPSLSDERYCRIKEQKNIELVICGSENEEARKVIEIAQRHCCASGNDRDVFYGTEKNANNAPSTNNTASSSVLNDNTALSQYAPEIAGYTRSIQGACTVFLGSNSLSSRIYSTLSLRGTEEVRCDDEHVISTLMLCVIEVVVSEGDAAHLLSMIKHGMVTIGYEDKEAYGAAVCQFETEIIRKHAVSGFEAITNAVYEVGSAESREYWRRVVEAIGPFMELDGKHSLGEIVQAHLKSIRNLVGGNSAYVKRDNCDGIFENIEAFFRNLTAYCKGKKIFTVRNYKHICKDLLECYFKDERNDIFSVGSVRSEVVIISGFNEGGFAPVRRSSLLNNTIRKKLRIPTDEEYKGIFLSILYNLFHAKRLYITRSVESCGKVTEAPLLIRYLDFLLSSFSNASKSSSYSTVSSVDLNIDKSAYLSKFLCEPNPKLEVRSQVFSVLTAEALGMLISNPYAFYSRYVLGIYPVKSVNTGNMAKNFAVTVRSIFLQYLKNMGLGSDYSALIDIAKREFATVCKSYPYIEKLWWPRFEAMAENFFQADRERKCNVSAIEVESDFTWDVSEGIKVISKCDSVSYLRDGSPLVVCYKIGMVPSQVDIQCGFASRGIIDSICVSESNEKKEVSFAYWRITPESVEITEIKDLPDVIKSAKEGLQNFLVKFQEEMIPFYPREDFSKFVEYELFSRIREKIPQYGKPY